MNAKHLSVIAAVTVVLIAAAFILMKRDQALPSGSEALLFKDFPINSVTELKIKAPKEEIRLVKVNEVWKVKNCYDYPADFMKMKNFITTVADLKKIQTVKADVTELGRLGLDLKGGDTAGTMVEFNSADSQKPLVSFVAGKKHSKQAGSEEGGFQGEWPDGRYLLIPNQEKQSVVVVDKTLDEIDQPAKDWMNRDFISARDIMAASLIDGGVQQWKLMRKKQGEPMVLESMPEKRELDTAKVNSVSNALGSIRFAEVQPPSLQATDTGLNTPLVFRAETFSGKVYEFLIGKKKDSFRFAKVKVSFQTPPDEEVEKAADDAAKKDEAAEKKKEEEKAEKIRKAQEEAKAEQEKYGMWTYTFPESSVSPMINTLEDLLKKIEAKKDDKAKGGAAAPGEGAQAEVPK